MKRGLTQSRGVRPIWIARDEQVPVLTSVRRQEIDGSYEKVSGTVAFDTETVESLFLLVTLFTPGRAFELGHLGGHGVPAHH